MSDTTLVIGGEDYELVRFTGLGSVFAMSDPLVTDGWDTLLTLGQRFIELDRDATDTSELRDMVTEWRDALAEFITDGKEHWEKATKKGWLGIRNLSRITQAYAEYVNDGTPTPPS